MIGRFAVLDNDTGARRSAVAEFEAFVARHEPHLRHALVAHYGPEEGRDATAEALAYAWEHWERVKVMANAPGYLYRVAQSRTRKRRQPAVFTQAEHAEPSIEPGLPDALRRLPQSQRVAVVLVHGFGWRATEVAEFTGVKPTTVQNHLERGLRRLRKSLGVPDAS
ncbi:MAG TPA: sigma factor-like helix-turn-helix DNA-binding protein [Acidimicrobiales bacterium]|jgi:DNA-directed RNA polymerase specialized sigma24 family protein